MKWLFEKEEPIGLEIQETFFKVGKLKKEGKFFKIEKLFSKPFVPNSTLKEKASLIKESLKDNGLSKFKYVITQVSEKEVYLTLVALPKLSKEKAKVAAIYEAQNYIPIPLNSAQVDAEILEATKNHLHVLVGAVKKEKIKELINLLKLANLLPLRIEPESKALVRSVIPQTYCNLSDINLILDFGEERTLVVIVQRSKVRFSSSIPIGSKLLTEIVRKSLKIKEKEVQVLKEKYGILEIEKVTFTSQAGELEKKVVKEEKLREIILPPLIDLLEQTKKYVDYYLEKEKHKLTKGNKIKRVFLSGKEAKLKGLKELVKDYLNTEVQIANPLVNLVPSPIENLEPISQKEALSYSITLGLALGAFYQNYD